MPEKAPPSLRPPPETIQDLIEALERERSEFCQAAHLSKITLAIAIVRGFQNFGSKGLQRAIIDA